VGSDAWLDHYWIQRFCSTTLLGRGALSWRAWVLNMRIW